MVSAIRYIAVLMLVVMLLQANSVVVYYGLFLLNRKAITEIMCEKKTMDCCGNCYLQKQIDAAHDPQPSSSPSQPSAKTLDELLKVFHCLLHDDQNALLSSAKGNTFVAHSPCFLSDGVLRPIEHPPNA